MIHDCPVFDSPANHSQLLNACVLSGMRLGRLWRQESVVESDTHTHCVNVKSILQKFLLQLLMPSHNGGTQAHQDLIHYKNVKNSQWTALLLHPDPRYFNEWAGRTRHHLASVLPRSHVNNWFSHAPKLFVTTVKWLLKSLAGCSVVFTLRESEQRRHSHSKPRRVCDSSNGFGLH